MSFYLNFRIKCIQQLTSNTIKIVFNEIDGKEISFLPGQFLTFFFDVEGKKVKRTYSICTSPSELPDIGIAIKAMEDGYASKYLVNNLRKGTTVQAFPPMGNFVIEPNPKQQRNIIMFAGGSGITPIFSMIKSVLETEIESYITLYYVNRYEEGIIFKNELEELHQKYQDKLKVIPSITKPTQNWDGETGRLDRKKSQELLKHFNEKTLKQSDYFLCGPAGMMEEVKSALNNFGVEETRIYQENFTTAVIDEDEEIEEKPRQVTVIFEGEKHVLTVQPEDSILETALDEGIDLPHSCQIGQCSTCMAKLISGQLKLVEQTALDDDDLGQGYCLTCVGYPASDDVAVLYDDD